jgi:hypothetical protein
VTTWLLDTNIVAYAIGAAHEKERRRRVAQVVAVTTAARTFLDPVLASDVDAIWSPETWSWRKTSPPP